jgi:hypothetical protein
MAGQLAAICSIRVPASGYATPKLKVLSELRLAHRAAKNPSKGGSCAMTLTVCSRVLWLITFATHSDEWLWSSA